MVKVCEKNLRRRLFSVRTVTVIHNFSMIFPKFMLVACWVLRTPGPIFQNSSEWVLLKIEAYNYVRLNPRQLLTQVCTPIQTNLWKPASWWPWLSKRSNGFALFSLFSFTNTVMNIPLVYVQLLMKLCQFWWLRVKDRDWRGTSNKNNSWYAASDFESWNLGNRLVKYRIH